MKLMIGEIGFNRSVIRLLLIIFILLDLVLVFSYFPSYALSQDGEETLQESDFDQAYSDYTRSLEEYQDAHEEYIFRKSQYENFKTLKSQEDAQVATANMLKARDAVEISYLEALRERLNETVGVTDARRESLNIRVNEEVVWYQDHQSRISGAGTLDDLVKDSDEAKKKLTQTELLAYEILSTIPSGRLNDYTERTDELYQNVRNKLDEIRSDDREDYTFSSEKFSVLDRWVFEAENRILRSEEKQDEVEDDIASLSRKRSDLLREYNGIISTLGEAQLFLKEANTFLKEIIREVKT